MLAEGVLGKKDMGSEQDGIMEPKEACLSPHMSCAPRLKTRDDDDNNNSDDERKN